jgi:hypothetical protein
MFNVIGTGPVAFTEVLLHVVDMDFTSTEDLHLAQERHRTFCGSFRIPISTLKFKTRSGTSSQVEQQKVRSILKQFNLVGCRHEEPEHRIPALIAPGVLPRGLCLRAQKILILATRSFFYMVDIGWKPRNGFVVIRGGQLIFTETVGFLFILSILC